MKRIRSLSLTLAILWSLCCTAPAFAADPVSTNAPEGELTFETITIGNETMVIPVVIKTTGLQTRMTRSGEMIQDITQDATYYIPVTDDDIAYNETYVQTAQAAQFTGTATDQNPDPKRYFILTSNINYTLYDSLDGTKKSSLLGMNKVWITRSSDPVGLDLDILGIENPTIEVAQTGMTDRGHGVVGGSGTWINYQIKTYDNAPWGTQGVDIPSDWYPVMIKDYGTTGYICRATFTIVFGYSDGKRICTFDHNLVK